MQYFTSPFPLPAQRIVGLLSCQIEPLVRSLDTRVVTCQVADKAAPSKETNQSKKAAKNKKVEEEEWEIELEDTILLV